MMQSSSALPAAVVVVGRAGDRRWPWLYNGHPLRRYTVASETSAPFPRVHYEPEVPGKAIKDAAKTGVTTMQELGNGTEIEVLVYKTACTCMNNSLSNSDDYNTIRGAIYERLSPDYQPGGTWNAVAKPAVGKASRAIAAIGADNGLGVFYVNHCLGLSPR